jgi:prefoldin subunit 5
VERKVERAIKSLEELKAEIERIIKTLQGEPNIDDMDMSYDFVPYKDNGRRNL